MTKAKGRIAAPVKVVTTLAALVLGAASLSGIAAVTTAEQARDVLAQMDTIDIEVTGTDGMTVIYDEPAPTSVRIDNQGASCWLRCRLELTSELGTADDGQASPSSEGWVARPDGWCYLTEPLAEDSAVDFSALVSCPDEWAGIESLSAVITVEAVQERNVTPDFGSDDPWGGIEAERAVYVNSGSENDGEVGVDVVVGSKGDEAR